MTVLPQLCRVLDTLTEGFRYDLACRAHDTVDLASLRSRDGARQIFAGSGDEMKAGEESPDLVGFLAHEWLAAPP